MHLLPTSCLLGASTTTAAAVVAAALPTVVGLLAIPIIAHPIDEAVGALLNNTLRPMLKARLQSAEKQALQSALAASS